MDNMLTIYDGRGNRLYDIEPDDDSYRIREVKGEHAIYLNLTLPVPINLPLGCYIEYEGIRYSLEEPAVILKNDPRNIKYQCVFSAPQALLARYRFRNTVDGRLKFQLTAKPHEHLQMLVKNLDIRGDSGWSVGECIDDVEKVIDYDYTVCYDALEMIAEAFGTEWEIRNKVISLKKVEYGKDNPLPLSYGRGNGFVSGVGRNNQNDKDSGLEIVYAIGGDRNIVPSKNTGGQKKQWDRPITSIAPIVVNPEFAAPMPMMAASSPAVQSAASSKITTTNPEGVAVGNKCLILPRGQELEYEGEVYCTDAQGYYVYKKNKPLTTRKEGALDCSEIYPSRVGTISEVIVVDEEKNFYDFVDSSIPDDLDYSECLMEGEKMTVIFQDGMLAGKEFDVKYKHATRRFEIVPQEVDNETMPNDIFKPVVGGKYAVFNVELPDAYVCDNESKTGASWDMFRKAAEYLHDHADYLFTFNGTLDGIWAKRNWEAIKDRLVPGGTILFSDNQFQPDGVKIRITSVKDFLCDPYRPEIELSNDVVGQKLIGRIATLENREVAEEVSASSGRQFTKRTFRDAKETMNKLQDALESFQGEFTEGISPITVNTMQLLVGSEQCQFEFVSGNGSDTVVDHNAGYGKGSGTFHCAAGWVRYQSGGSVMTGNPAWLYAYAPAFTSGALTADNADKFYYVYMRVSGTKGEFIMSETPKDLTAGSIRYLLLGILDSEQFGNRSWCPMYGYTEITPGRIRVDKIISPKGNAYFDLQNEEIGGRINFMDGLVSGEVGVAGSTGAVNAGMSGADDEDVRFWAGATSDDKAAAPFRVHDNGNVVMNDAMIGGDSTFGGLLKQNVITIDGMFVTGDTNGKMIFYSPIGGDKPIIDWSQIFGFRTTVIIKSLPAFDFRNEMFGLNKEGAITPSYFRGNLHDYIGNRIRIINESSKLVEIENNFIRRLDEVDDFHGNEYDFDVEQKAVIEAGQELDIEFKIFTCQIHLTDGGWDRIVKRKVMGWEVLYEGTSTTSERN